MDNEKDFLENEEATNEAASEVVEAVEDAAEEVIEEAAEEFAEEFSEEAGEVFEASDDIIPEIPEKKSSLSKPAVATISAAITLVCCIAIAAALYFAYYNPYNANKDGFEITLAGVAKINDKTVEEFKEEYGFPTDMRDDTVVSVLQSYQKLGKMAEQYGMSFDEFKKAMKLDDVEDITEDTYYGVINRMEYDKALAEKEEQAGESKDKADDAKEATDEKSDEKAGEETKDAPAEEAKSEKAE